MFDMQSLATGGAIAVRFHRGRQVWQVVQDNTTLFSTPYHEVAMEVATDLIGLAGNIEQEARLNVAFAEEITSVEVTA